MTMNGWMKLAAALFAAASFAGCSLLKVAVAAKHDHSLYASHVFGLDRRAIVVLLIAHHNRLRTFFPDVRNDILRKF